MASMKNALLGNRTLWRVLFALSVLAILVLATADTRFPLPSTPSDKLNHLLAFLELTLLARLGWPALQAFWLIPGLLAFGLAIEGVQANLPYRDFSLADLAADACGIGLGLLPWPIVREARKKGLRDSPNSA